MGEEVPVGGEESVTDDEEDSSSENLPSDDSNVYCEDLEDENRNEEQETSGSVMLNGDNPSLEDTSTESSTTSEEDEKPFYCIYDKEPEEHSWINMDFVNMYTQDSEGENENICEDIHETERNRSRCQYFTSTSLIELSGQTELVTNVTLSTSRSSLCTKGGYFPQKGQ